MIFKKHKNNEYSLTSTSKIWVRNFACNGHAIDINNLYKSSEIERVISNEIKNQALRIIDLEEIDFENVMIVSDGFNFLKIHELIKDMEGEFMIICVNKALKKWKIQKKIDYYLLNNPYEESLNFLPSKYFPPCITSTRTCTEFLKRYKGLLYHYFPTPNEKFSLTNEGKIDDYRNPISAAISLVSGKSINKLLLFSCDDSSSTLKPGMTIANEENLFCYPQQLMIKEIVENQIGWLKKNKPDVVVGSFSAMNYKNIEKIPFQNLLKFFVD